MKTSFYYLFCLLFSFHPAVSAQEPGKIPVNKNLSSTWVQSLYERGEPTRYYQSRNELQYIGMPVGGINCGGVYLGGDGRLWLWDIFNETKEGIQPNLVMWNDMKVRPRDGACYVEPARPMHPLQQGFLIRIEYDGKTVCKTLEESSWDDISFEATYPIGTVRYIDKKLPLELTLQAYSPFIPLNEDESGLPATILSFQVKNNGSAPAKVTLLGYLENKTSIRSADPTVCRRENAITRNETGVTVSESLLILNEKRKSALTEQPDYGTLSISALNKNATAYTYVSPDAIRNFGCTPSLNSSSSHNPDGLSSASDMIQADQTSPLSKPVLEPLIGGVQSTVDVSAGQSGNADFVIAWHFTNLKVDNKVPDTGRYYQNKFASAGEVSAYIARNFERLSSTTLLWADTWQNSTLPHWFLERTLLNINTLATANCHRFSSGRFWAWEGVGACAGTCTHVWQYAQAMGRLFPALERDCRERTDLNIAMQPDGGIIFRAEMETRPAIDGQAGTVLRCYREHQMSADDAFLRRNWPNIKRAVQFIINQDRNGDGMEDTPMENTLDAVWDGEIAWIVGLCISGVRAGQEMAEEVGDTDFARICADYVKKGSKNMDKYLFNGEYYIHRPDKEKGRTNLGSYNTSHIDQVMGQSWAHQVGLGRIQDRNKTISALNALWKYNYTPDVGPYIAVHKGGRPYALPGEGGMIMNTNPKNEPKPYGDNVTWQMGYFHECMSGFEYQVAAHMIAEGMTDKGLTLVRSIHDRYHASKRNPFNEIECSDHYARAMASYGAFITACGFEYHGPKGYMRFAPKWSQADFKAPFTAAEGWGTYTQKQDKGSMLCTLQPQYGKVQLKTFAVEAPAKRKVKSVMVHIDGTNRAASMQQQGSEVIITFGTPVIVNKGQELEIKLL